MTDPLRDASIQISEKEQQPIFHMFHAWHYVVFQLTLPTMVMPIAWLLPPMAYISSHLERMKSCVYGRHSQDATPWLTMGD